jgi:hypothetical protein
LLCYASSRVPRPAASGDQEGMSAVT